MMPIIFAVDNEFAKKVDQWLLISKKDLRKILAGIEQFMKMRASEDR